MTRSIAVTRITPVEAMRQIEAHWNLDGGATTRAIALAANAARTAISECPGSCSTTAVRRILRDRLGELYKGAQIESAIGPDLGAAGSAWEDAILKRLSKVGDAYMDSANRWHATPWRLVRLAQTSSYVLVLGGTDTAAIQRRLGAPVHQYGVVRYCSYEMLSASDRKNTSLWQSIEHWLRMERTDISSWTSSVIEEAMSHSSPGAPLGLDEYEVFALARGRHAWKPIDQIAALSSSVHICRSLMPGSRVRKEYWLAVFRMLAGAPQLQRFSRLKTNDALRVVLGLVHGSGTKQNIRYYLTDDELSVSLRGGIPYPERTLIDIGLRGEGQTYRWPRCFQHLVLETLASLGFEFREEQVDASHDKP